MNRDQEKAMFARSGKNRSGLSSRDLEEENVGIVRRFLKGKIPEEEIDYHAFRIGKRMMN